MRIRSTETIAGFPILRVRDCLGKLREADSWGADALGHYLKASEGRIRPLLAELRGQAYIERVEDESGIRWRVTELGWRFANATAARPISRSTAERLVREFLTRVDEVNWNPHYLYRVSRVVVFGSYLTESSTLGDVDLAVTLEPKEPDREKRRHREDERISQAAASGRQFSTFLDQLAWPQCEVQLFLKGRSRYIKIHSDSDGVLTRTRTRLLFESIPKAEGSR